jgi:hypothetical protein
MKMDELQILGWREWVALPELGINSIKAKIDTGARTSTLHAFYVSPFKKNGRHKVRFIVHPHQRRRDEIVACEADVLDIRWVTDSGGHRARRYVIETTLQLANLNWKIELTLTNRDVLRFRMLLGRTALRHRVLVDPGASYLVGKL